MKERVQRENDGTESLVFRLGREKIRGRKRQRGRKEQRRKNGEEMMGKGKYNEVK